MARRFPAGGRKGQGPTLPDSELQIMRILWQLGKGTAREVWTGRAANKAPSEMPSYGNVRVLLEKLEAKGFVTADKSRLTFIYHPAVQKRSVATKRIKEVADKFFDGSIGKLVAQTLKWFPVSDADKSDIRAALGDK